MTKTQVRDGVMRDTLAHVRRVGNLLLDVVERLQRAAMRHDDSKFSVEEFDHFAVESPKLAALTFGSDEYKAALERLAPALRHHYALNTHHPEHHAIGIKGMDLLQLLELLADWKAASERHTDGNLVKSIYDSAARFGYDEDMANLLARTAVNLGWITEQQMQTMPRIKK